jgi:L-rhamnose mutarotase
MGRVIRRAFTLRLEPQALDLYTEHHRNIWPELVEEIERSGIATMTAFATDPVVFYSSEIRDPGAWDRLWSTPVHDRWGELFKPLIAFNAEGKVDAGELQEIFHLQTAEADTVRRRAYSIQLEPGALPAYRALHNAIWPELVEEMRQIGIARLTAFESDPTVFYFAEILEDDAFDRLWRSEVHERWARLFTPLIAFTDARQVDARFMDEIFHLETAAR